MKRLTEKQALDQGFTVDHHAPGRPFAYKGPRFRVEDSRECYTELEERMLALLVKIHGVTGFADITDFFEEIGHDYTP